MAAWKRVERQSAGDRHPFRSAFAQQRPEIEMRRYLAADPELGLRPPPPQPREGRQRRLEPLVRRHEAERRDEERRRRDAKSLARGRRVRLVGRRQAVEIDRKRHHFDCRRGAAGGNPAERRSRVHEHAAAAVDQRLEEREAPDIDRMMGVEQPARRTLAGRTRGVAQRFHVSRRVPRPSVSSRTR
jgi:hypothetical protein